MSDGWDADSGYGHVHELPLTLSTTPGVAAARAPLRSVRMGARNSGLFLPTPSHAFPRLPTPSHAFPRLLTHDRAFSRLLTHDRAFPRLLTRDRASPRLLTHDRASPRRLPGAHGRPQFGPLLPCGDA